MPGWWMWLNGWLLQASMTLVDVDTRALGGDGQLVGVGDVQVAVGRLGQLRQLGCLGRPEVPHPVRPGRGQARSSNSRNDS